MARRVYLGVIGFACEEGSEEGLGVLLLVVDEEREEEEEEGGGWSSVNAAQGTWKSRALARPFEPMGPSSGS